MTTDQQQVQSPGAAPISLRIEQRFFMVTRWAGLIGAALAITIAVIMISLAGWQMTRSANTDVSPEVPKYRDLKEATERSKDNTSKNSNNDKELKKKELAASKAQADLDFEKKLQPYIDKIHKSLSAYTEATHNASPSRDGLRNYIKGNMDAISSNVPDKEDLPWDYVEGMTEASSDLAADASRLAALPEADPARVDVDTFVTWYSKQFFGNIGAEHKRIQAEEARSMRGKIEAGGQFIAAASAFGVFAALTILLVLLRIERNTRSRAA